ncbi:hypothetical protein B0H13DRAFT_2659235 [Mycena leptocephala]|nr:hypothetical protein B0H13DRAFT_2659235 [Mycena leptocephala]
MPILLSAPCSHLTDAASVPLLLILVHLAVVLAFWTMFSNGTGHQVHGGTFYDVDGDVNLRTYHLAIQDCESQETAFQLLADSTRGLGDGRSERSRRSRHIQDSVSHAASFLPLSDSHSAYYGRTVGSEPKGVGISRNSRRAVGARQSPYDMASRPRHPGISSNDEVSAGPSSLNSSEFIPPSGEWTGPSQTSEFNCPAFEPSSTSRSVWSPALNSRSQYPIAYSHSNGPTILGHFSAGLDQNSAPAPDYMAHSSDDERRDDGYVTPYLDPFHSGPATSIRGGTFITAGNVNFYGKKCRREDGTPTERADKRHRREEEQGIEVIRSKNLKLLREIGSGPDYFLHAAENKGRAVTVKVFNTGTVRQRLESTVALAKGVMHPNVLRIEGISSPASLFHFIAYENVHWKNPEGPLSVALKNDLTRSITLGFKMIAGLSAGMNHLSVKGVSLGSMGVKNFDVFLDVDDRFLISINPGSSEEIDTAEFQEPDDKSWSVFNALCQRVLMSANRVLHNEEIDRDPAVLELLRPSSVSRNSATASLLSFGSAMSQNIQEEENPVLPRREYVWRIIDRGQQSLATVAHRITLDLDTNLSPLHRLTQMDGLSPHRCAGYVREEITLTTTTLDSAVVSHDTPTPLEICSICHEVVALHEAFDCICGDPTPGSRHTIKCQVCKLWSHSDCVGNPKVFTCQFCEAWQPDDPRLQAPTPTSMYPPQQQISPSHDQQTFPLPTSPTNNISPQAKEYPAETPARNGATPLSAHIPVNYNPDGYVPSIHHASEPDAHYWKNMFLELGFGDGDLAQSSADSHQLPYHMHPVPVNYNPDGYVPSIHHTSELDAHYWKNMFLELGFGDGDLAQSSADSH